MKELLFYSKCRPVSPGPAALKEVQRVLEARGLASEGEKLLRRMGERTPKRRRQRRHPDVERRRWWTVHHPPIAPDHYAAQGCGRRVLCSSFSHVPRRIRLAKAHAARVVNQPLSHGFMGNGRRLKRAMRASHFHERVEGGGYGGIQRLEVLMDFAEPRIWTTMPLYRASA
jgi:hypothetical protein